MVGGTVHVPKFTIGMAHFDDYHGAYFTIQDIRKELLFHGYGNMLELIEFVVVDNNHESAHGKQLEKFLQKQVTATNNVRMIKMTNTIGTSATRNAIIEKADTEFVLVMDCHVMLCPVTKVIPMLIDFMLNNPDTDDLYTGPLVADTMQGLSTHFNDVWAGGMWGQWGSTFECHCGWKFTGVPKDGMIEFRKIVEQEPITACHFCGKELPVLKHYGWKREMAELEYRQPAWDDDLKFEIPSQGLGMFLTRKDSWLGFNPYSIAFGGEEGYIHEKYRRAGRKCWNLSFLKWMHRFNRPDGIKYPISVDGKCRNYIYEFIELGMNIDPVVDHFISLGVKPHVIKYHVDEAKRVYNA